MEQALIGRLSKLLHVPMPYQNDNLLVVVVMPHDRRIRCGPTANDDVPCPAVALPYRHHTSAVMMMDMPPR